LALLQIIFLSTTSNASQIDNPKKIPTKVRSNIIDIKKNLHVIDFIGNVIVEKDQDSILADKMILFYQENKSDNQTTKSKIEKIEASDNVKFFSKDYVATSKNGYYNPDQDLLTLENDVVVNNGTSIAKGNKFIYNFKTKKGNLTEQDRVKRATVIIGNDKPLE
jgi:lipopolysaccharide export system protein LptA